MYIHGSMLRLDSDARSIPIPWWLRAPLGFETGTQVFVAITEPQKSKSGVGHPSRPGDLIVSVLDPNRLNECVTVQCTSIDRPGVIEDVFRCADGWKIVLAETQVVENGSLLDVSLILQTTRAVSMDNDRLDELNNKLMERFSAATVQRLAELNSQMVFTRLGTVEHGCVKVPGTSWHDVIVKQLSQLETGHLFDPTRLVTFADTTSRMFKAVIPRRGALSVTIEHADRPEALGMITNALKKIETNPLSMLLKRGGASAGNAIAIVVCEPAEGASGSNLRAEIERTLLTLPSNLRVQTKMGTGEPANSALYGFPPRLLDGEPVAQERYLEPEIAPLRSRKQFVLLCSLLTATLEPVLNYDPSIFRNEPPPELWRNDEQYLQCLREIVIELRNLNKHLSSHSPSADATSAKVLNLKELFADFVRTYTHVLATSAGYATVGVMVALLYSAGVGHEIAAKIVSAIKILKYNSICKSGLAKPTR